MNIQEEKTQLKMNYCPKCGFEVKEMKFCPKCGFNLSKVSLPFLAGKKPINDTGLFDEQTSELVRSTGLMGKAVREEIKAAQEESHSNDRIGQASTITALYTSGNEWQASNKNIDLISKNGISYSNEVNKNDLVSTDDRKKNKRIVYFSVIAVITIIVVIICAVIGPGMAKVSDKEAGDAVH